MVESFELDWINEYIKSTLNQYKWCMQDVYENVYRNMKMGKNYIFCHFLFLKMTFYLVWNSFEELKRRIHLFYLAFACELMWWNLKVTYSHFFFEVLKYFIYILFADLDKINFFIYYWGKLEQDNEDKSEKLIKIVFLIKWINNNC